MFNYELFEEMITHRIFLEYISDELLQKSFLILKRERQKRLNDRFFSVLYPKTKRN